MANNEKTGGLPHIPVSDLLSSAANSLAQAQEAMNATSLHEEIELKRSGMHKQGFRAHWYTIPEVNMNIKLVMDVNQDGQVQSQLVDGAYQQKYGFNVQGASTLSTRIKTVPSESLSQMSLHKEEDILAKIGDIKEVLIRFETCENPTITAWYQPFSTQGYDGGFWQIVLTDTLSEGNIVLLASAVIDDRTGDFLQYKLF